MMLAEKSRWGRPGLEDHSDPSEESAGNKRRRNLFNTCVSPQCLSKPEREVVKKKKKKKAKI